ncbi:CYFA0S07e03829g1_1 [Cyberlindnera fabianii]|uniref:CYFA0S07e03829g1_1 n=1 Tax=Cyberlindnera fabianii TaxID=36022 RepID=A0A061B1T0_CYBFA|nr:CYFA0S07e03829g1_1 [Cyberlindnera fabianii]
MAHLRGSRPPIFFEDPPSEVSDAENQSPIQLKPLVSPVNPNRTVLATLNIQGLSPVSSSGSSQCELTSTCASTRAIHSANWQHQQLQRQQLSLFHRDHGVQGIDTTLRSGESGNKDNTQLHPRQRQHWFQKLNIFQKFRKQEDDKLCELNMASLSDALSCYNEYKTRNMKQLFEEVQSVVELQKMESGIQVQLMQRQIPIFAPLHELDLEQLNLLSQHIFDLPVISAGSDIDISVTDEADHLEEKQDDELDLRSVTLDEKDDVSMIPMLPTAISHFDSALLSSAISPMIISGEFSGSIQSSHELILDEHLPKLIASRLVVVLEHEPLPASSVYSPFDSLKYRAKSTSPTSFDFQSQGSSSGAPLMSPIETESSISSPTPEMMVVDSSPFIMIPSRLPGVKTAPTTQQVNLIPDFASRMESMMNKFHKLKIESGQISCRDLNGSKI